MFKYTFKCLLLFLYSSAIIFIYYFVANGHMESFSPFSLYIPYIVILFVIYTIYKGSVHLFSYRPEKIVFKPYGIFLFFLLHLLVLSCFFYSSNGADFAPGFILFFNICRMSIAPILFFIISYALGRSLLSGFSSFNKHSEIFKSLIGLGFGFAIIISLITIFGIFGLYNIYIVLGILFLGGIIGYKQIIGFYTFFFSHEIECENYCKKGLGLNLLTSEFLFIIASFLISVNLINVYRPMPIGWDDLGVYMNYAKLMSESGSILSLGSMYAWQIFTGIGYMISGATQAFFFNSIGGGLSFLCVYFIAKDLLKGEKKTFINIPLLLATSFISMPMVIFQLAKDMKLDPGLFFVSSIALYLFYKVF